MNIQKGQTVKIQTSSFGEVSVRNADDKTLHFYFLRNGREDNGFIVIENGEVVMVSNIPQKLINEIGAAL